MKSIIQYLHNNSYTDVASTSGRFSAFMTDEQWQNRFQKMKEETIPSKHKNMKQCREEIYIRDSYTNTLFGASNYQQYSFFINDVLKCIRSGSEDYCYFVYQIKDLLRFEPERLRTRYDPTSQTCMVWLEDSKTLSQQ